MSEPAPAAPQPSYQPTAPADPGKTLGIVGLILSFVACVIGLIVSIIAFRSSKKAGYKNTVALVGIIIGAVATLGWIIGGIAIGGVVAKCAELGPGVHEVGGTTYTCGG